MKSLDSSKLVACDRNTKFKTVVKYLSMTKLALFSVNIVKNINASVQNKTLNDVSAFTKKGRVFVT